MRILAAGIVVEAARHSVCLLPERQARKKSFLAVEPRCKRNCGTTTVAPVDVYLNNKSTNTPPDAVALPFDGYFEMGCYSDNTPAARIEYAPKEQKVSPKQCFNFCRDKPQARFFGLTLGRECYCTPYPTLGGGNGGCTRQCEGDANFMCGGDSMSTVYEMHRCGDVTEVAQKDKTEAEAVIEKADFFTGRCEAVVQSLTAAAEGIDVSDVRKRVFGLAATLEELRKDTVNKRNDADAKLAPLASALAAFDEGAATAEMMRAVEEAQADLLGFVALLEDSYDNLEAYWNEHSLDNSMAFRSIDSKALGSSEELSKALPSEINFLPSKVASELDGEQNHADFTYLVVGKQHLASLFQVYNPASPIEGRPTGNSATSLSVQDWEKWTVKECHQMCVMTPGCVGGNVIGASTQAMWASTCNLKGSVERVEMSKSKPASTMMKGFIFSSYYSLRSDKIEFNTANVLIQ
mmetsp:Transcript_13942/g.33749  ORF Transcript_13942/g.33749 Transcript_13942/m.33749 type:complete len:464 (-) Transcript_13942:29-1420(-)